MIQTKFDIIDFSSLTAAQWRKRYKSDIRVSVKWDRVKIKQCGIIKADKKTKILLPWYGKNRSWMDGSPKKIKIGTDLRLIRIPALKICKDDFLVLDGCHRLTELNPSIVIIDWITTKDTRYFVDIRNEYFST